ncbi:MAG: DUF1800 family protein, partial [Blastocatellia bacterium]
MKKVRLYRARSLAMVAAGLFVWMLVVAALAAWPFAAQQIPFDESRIVADLTAELRLAPEQTATLNELLQRRRPRVDALLQQMSQFQPGSPHHNELRGQLERERRAVMEEFLPTLKPEQQTRLRGLMTAPNPPPPQPASPIPAIRPNLPAGALSAGERLITAPTLSNENTRSRRASAATSPLTEEQKILHLLNRAGFGPRPGDIERVKQMGIERYLDEQLHPEDLADDFLARPLQSLNTLQ